MFTFLDLRGLLDLLEPSVKRVWEVYPRVVPTVELKPRHSGIVSLRSTEVGLETVYLDT